MCKVSEGMSQGGSSGGCKFSGQASLEVRGEKVEDLVGPSSFSFFRGKTSQHLNNT